jgi:hypothetical protein
MANPARDGRALKFDGLLVEQVDEGRGEAPCVFLRALANRVRLVLGDVAEQNPESEGADAYGDEAKQR